MAQRGPTLRRAVSDFLISVSAVGILLALLVSLDVRVREEATALVNGQRANQVAATTGQARRFVNTVVGVVKDQSSEHGPLMVMLMFGTGLALVMFRT
jgi:hypothetical protein